MNSPCPRAANALLPSMLGSKSGWILGKRESCCVSLQFVVATNYASFCEEDQKVTEKIVITLILGYTSQVTIFFSKHDSFTFIKGKF